MEVMHNCNTGNLLGFAFVVFTSDEMVKLILNSGLHEINHKVVYVTRAQARGVAPLSIHHGDGDGDGGGSVVGSSSGGGGSIGLHTGGGGLRGGRPRIMVPMKQIFVGGLPLYVDKDGLKDFSQCLAQ